MFRRRDYYYYYQTLSNEIPRPNDFFRDGTEFAGHSKLMSAALQWSDPHVCCRRLSPSAVSSQSVKHFLLKGLNR